MGWRGQSRQELVWIMCLSFVAVMVLFFGFRAVEEACDVGDNWTCNVVDDGFHDREFNWRHGVFPW